MKKTYNGIIYDSDKAEFIDFKPRGQYSNDFGYSCEELYRTEDGHFFLYCTGNAGTMWAARDCLGAREPGEYIIPVDKRTADYWENDDIEAAEILYDFLERQEERLIF